MREEIIISMPKKELEELVRSSVLSAIEQSERPKQGKELMTFEDTREFLDISASTLFKWKRENRIPYRRIGKRIYFHKGEIIHAMNKSQYHKIKEIRKWHTIY